MTDPQPDALAVPVPTPFSKRLRRFAIIGLIALSLRILFAYHEGFWTKPLVPVGGEANMIAVNLASGAGYATPFLRPTNLPVWAQALLPSKSPMGHPILEVPGKLPPSAHSAPGYVFLLAGLIKATHALGLEPNTPYRLVLLLGILVSTAGVLLSTWFAGETFGAPGEWCAGLLLGCWPRLIRFSATLWDTSFTLAGVSGCFLFIILWKRGVSIRSFAVFGIYAGLLMLFNPILALVLGVTLVAGVWERVPRANRVVTFLAAIAVWGLCITPWTIRNAVEFKRFIPIRNNFGFEMWLGTLPEFDGTSGSLMCRHPMEVRSEQELVAKMGEDPYFRMRARNGLEAICTDPAEFISRTLLRIRLYWINPFVFRTANPGLSAWLIFLADMVKLAGAAVGFFAYKDRLTRCVLLAAVLLIPLPYYATHVAASYRIHVEPFLWLMFTGFAFTIWKKLALNWTKSTP